MEITLLRKMARKSPLTFGQYADNTVQDLISLKKYGYLRWVYFNSSRITFMDDILEKINIPEDFRIEKPGTCSEKHEELNEILQSRMHGLSRHIMKLKAKKNMRIKHTAIGKQGSGRFTKDSLQKKNHGHKYN